jgi:hypothetical protein
MTGRVSLPKEYYIHTESESEDEAWEIEELERTHFWKILVEIMKSSGRN